MLNNRRGQTEIQTIIGGIFSILILVIFISAMIPVFQSLTGADQKQAEINKLANENAALKQEIDNKEAKVSRLTSILNSLNSTIGEKDSVIANLTGQLNETKNELAEVSQELENYKERTYLPNINNNYYNILNYVERIENKFYTINLAIGFISITLLTIVVKLFSLDVTIKLFWQKIRRRRRQENSGSG